MMGSISDNAAKDYAETFAEAFGDVYTNGENANPLSQEIKRLTDEKIRLMRGE